MKRILGFSFAALLVLMQVASAQQTYSNDKVEYTFDLIGSPGLTG